MEFRIADTFTASLCKLTADEQKLVKQTAFDAQVNPASPGLRFHKLERGRDKNFWSLSVGMDIRIIVHRTTQSLLFCYVDHHDKAYAWAEKRKLEVHPQTGAAQLVEVREVVQTVTRHEPERTAKRAIFAAISDEQLLNYGVPEAWLPAVRALVDHDALLELASYLPAEAGEALLDMALGRTPDVVGYAPVTSAATQDFSVAFQHPDAQRRFRLMGSAEELQRALDYPWDKWLVFLHPDQRTLVEGSFNGPIKVCGSAGTGKTVVALHRAAHLARTNPDARILLTTLSDPLAHALRNKLNCLLAHEPKLAERIDVRALAAQAQRLFRLREPDIARGVTLATKAHILDILRQEVAALQLKGYTERFLYAEWHELVDARQLTSWEEYRVTPRLGRKTRLSEQRRQALWAVFERVNNALAEQNLYTEASLYTRLSFLMAETTNPPFDFVVVDEAQDLSYAQMRFVAALGAHRPDALCFCGDLGQRIFQLPFSWKSLGVDVRGRSFTLRVNYRTSHQIRSQADKLLDAELTDADGNVEKRSNPISAFNGPQPDIRSFTSQEEESLNVAQWLAARQADGVAAREMAVFVRSEAEIPRVEAALHQAEIPYAILDRDMDIPKDSATIAVMHLAKGLEFYAVAVMACDADVIPSQQRIEDMGDDADLEDVYNTERQLLYVACTRARDYLLICGVEQTSEFMDDLIV